MFHYSDLKWTLKNFDFQNQSSDNQRNRKTTYCQEIVYSIWQAHRQVHHLYIWSRIVYFRCSIWFCLAYCCVKRRSKIYQNANRLSFTDGHFPVNLNGYQLTTDRQISIELGPIVVHIKFAWPQSVQSAKLQITQFNTLVCHCVN